MHCVCVTVQADCGVYHATPVPQHEQDVHPEEPGSRQLQREAESNLAGRQRRVHGICRLLYTGKALPVCSS